MLKLIFKYLSILGLLIVGVMIPGKRASAASCCGGGFATPSLIAGDDRAQLTGSYSFSSVQTYVGSDQIWRPRSTPESREVYQIEGAHLLSDRWQIGGGVPLVRRSLGEESSAGLGDVTASVGYEYLPDWDYNPWRPKGLGYIQLTVPTGRDMREADSDLQLDSRGRGFWALGVGTLLSKIFGRWDSFTSFEAHRSLPRHDSGGSGNRRLRPGYGGNLSVGAGYNFN